MNGSATELEARISLAEKEHRFLIRFGHSLDAMERIVDELRAIADLRARRT